MSEPRYTQTDGVFSMACSVAANIKADARIVWRVLTDAPGYPRWNSTVTGIEGVIREGERLTLHVPGTSRTFRPKISGFLPERRMLWSNGVAGIFKGVRIFNLMPHQNGSTDFVMEERFSGVMFALTKSMLPDFRPIFEAFAADLKREAQRVAHAEK